MKLSMPEARARLAELVQAVLDSPGQTLVVDYHDRHERLVLTTETRIRSLEALTNELLAQAARPPLEPSGTRPVELTAEQYDALLQQRTEAKAAWLARIQELSTE
jgi:hypothetical protein